MQRYEVAILYHPDLEVDLTKAEERVQKILADNKGKITATDNWGKKKLAYPIAKNEYAVYVFYQTELDPLSIGKIESTLNITDEVLRYLIVRIDEKELAKAERAKQAAAKRKPQIDKDATEESDKNEA